MYKIIKAILDFSFSLILIIITFPILILSMLIIFFEDSKTSPIFKQPRIGRCNKTFYVYKLRTMKQLTEKNESDSVRMLKSGIIFRKLSIDEIPQLFNILKGEMSFIGPRPLLVRYLPYYSKRELSRHSVKPGITGLAQVNGRNNLNWDKRLQYDVDYVNNFSFILDINILILTFKKIIISEDVVVDPTSIMQDLDQERSNGNKKVGC